MSTGFNSSSVIFLLSLLSLLLLLGAATSQSTLKTCGIGEGLCDDRETCISVALSNATCPCPSGQTYCSHAKRCFEPTRSCTQADFGCFLNQYKCSYEIQVVVGGVIRLQTREICTRSSEDCDCFRQDSQKPFHCKDGNFCTDSIIKCQTINPCPSNATHRCPDGTCASTWQDCLCRADGRKWCSIFQRCIEQDAQCTDPCVGNENRFYCIPRNQCTRSDTDCKCKVELRNDDAIFCPLKRKCVSRAAECVDDRNECDRQFLVKCNGTTSLYPSIVCGPNAQACHNCLSRNTVPCPDGRCVMNYTECYQVREAQDTECSRYGWVSCRSVSNSRRTCAPTTDHCSAEKLECSAFGWTFCSGYENKCVPDTSFCPVDRCAERNMFRCPSGECKQFKEQCVRTCTHPNTEQCPDGTCVQSRLDCIYGACPEGQTRCESGECIDPSVTTCCSREQFRCPHNSQCVNRVEECLFTRANQTCEHSRIQCFQKCVTNVRDCLFETCSADRPIQCNDGTCRSDASQCACSATDEIYCPNKKSCIKSSSHYDCIDCPQGSIRCNLNHACYERQEDCDKAANQTMTRCPPGLAYCSESKRCVSSLTQCSVGRCPFVCPPRNTDERPTCANSIEECCPVGTVFCSINGQCVKREDFVDGCPVAHGFKCTSENPHRCFNRTCVADIRDCLCTGNLFRCSNGACVRSLNDCAERFASQLCRDGVLCTDGTCRDKQEQCGSENICPMGYKRCPNGIDCIQANEDGGLCPQTAPCPQTRPIFCRSSKLCVTDIKFCPSVIRCPVNRRYLCSTTNECVSRIEDCLPSFSSCARNQVRCPITGECRATYDQCPTGIVCPRDSLLCPNGHQCRRSIDDCLDIRCPNFTCPNGECRERVELCGTQRQCPRDHYLCDNGECKADARDCRNLNCKSGYKLCLGSFECIPERFDCPQVSRCPRDSPIKCPDDSCVDSIDKCRNSRRCPEKHVLCSNGFTCVPEEFPERCPRSTLCPTSAPIKCANSDRCVSSSEQCDSTLDKPCPEGTVLCPNRECARSLSLCTSSTVCSNGVLCWDRSCRNSREQCPEPPKIQEACPGSFPFRCTDGSCRKTRFDCPSPSNCPSDMFNCGGVCVRSSEECKSPAVECSQDEFLCPNGRECAKRDLSTRCTPIPTCTDKEPYRCWDGTCRSGERACPSEVTRNCTSPSKLCWNGECVSSSGECLPKPTQCPADKPVMCPDFSCQQNREACASKEFKCPGSSVFCARTRSCVRTASDCKVDQKCGNGLHLCEDGSCVRDQRECRNSDGCPLDSPFRCRNDGSCVTTEAACNRVAEIACSSGSKCPDGSCRASCNNVLRNGCTSDKPKYCRSSQSCIGASETCNPSTVCADMSMIRCPSGLCVREESQCRAPSVEEIVSCRVQTEGKRPFPCADGTCVSDPRECTPVNSCPTGTVRCPNGRCLSSNEECKGLATSCPTRLPYRCPDGTCATSQNACFAVNGCPSELPHRCTNGRCVKSQDACASDDDILSNGCRRRAPVRCESNNACVVSENQCPELNGCPRDRPVRCETSRECATTVADCSASTCSGVICPDGSCANNRESCRTRNQCPTTRPIRCESGDCVLNPRECRPTIRCPEEKPFLCANFDCVGSEQECRAVRDCPSERPYQCLDGTCAFNETFCSASNCPSSSPFRCRLTGNCVRDARMCEIDSGVRCTFESLRQKEPSDRLFYCVLDGQCKSSPNECIRDTPCFRVDNDGTRKELVRCWDGTCKEKAEECPELPACLSTSFPYRCRDGSCAANRTVCSVREQSLGDCPTGETRCADGVCRKECSRSRGCPSGQVICPDLRCVDRIESCRQCPGDYNKFVCWDGKCHDKCPLPPRIRTVEATVSAVELHLKLEDERGEVSRDSPVAEVIIPPFSILPDGKVTSDSDSISSVVIDSPREEDIARAYQQASEKNDESQQQLWNICTGMIRIKALDHEGRERKSASLASPTTMRLPKLESCEELREGFKYRLGTFSGEGKELKLERDMKVESGSGRRTLVGYTDHFSEFVGVSSREDDPSPSPSPSPSPGPAPGPGPGDDGRVGSAPTLFNNTHTLLLQGIISLISLIIFLAQ